MELLKILKFGYSTPWLTKNILKFWCSNASHNIYSQLKISPYISYRDALEMHASL